MEAEVGNAGRQDGIIQGQFVLFDLVGIPITGFVARVLAADLGVERVQAGQNIVELGDLIVARLHRLDLIHQLRIHELDLLALNHLDQGLDVARGDSGSYIECRVIADTEIHRTLLAARA